MIWKAIFDNLCLGLIATVGINKFGIWKQEPGHCNITYFNDAIYILIEALKIM